MGNAIITLARHAIEVLGVRIKIVTFNIHKGFSWFNQKVTLEEMKTHLQALGADMVCLQEVLGWHELFAPRPQFEFLADRVWTHYAYGKNAVYSKGHHGNAILSRFPFESYENLDLSNHRFERRGLLHGVVSCPEWNGRKVHIMTAHLDLLSWGRERQLTKLCEAIRARVPEGEPLILAGDFNDWAEELGAGLDERAGLREVFLDRNGEHARTFPAVWPYLKLDRIYVRGFRVLEVETLSGLPWSRLSDHLALAAVLEEDSP
jgi:endonuclease/exonuclease/phosphatase family metal-dependent hydrolase